MYDGEVKWLPVRTAAKRLGVSMVRIYQLVERGELTALKVDCTTLVSTRSLDARAEMNRRRVRRAA